MYCSPPGSSVHGIFQAWVLEWVAIPFSRGSSPPRNRTQVSCIAHTPDQTGPPACSWPRLRGGALPAAPGSSPIGWSVGFWTQHPALFHFPSKICWGFQISFWWAHPGLLSPYVFCVFDCAGGILKGIGGLHSKWCGLSKLFSIFIIEMDQSPFFFLDDLKL